VTGIALLTVITASKFIYQFILYPEYFTPLKHIHSPKVWFHTPCD
jgi:hypothetical protein